MSDDDRLSSNYQHLAYTGSTVARIDAQNGAILKELDSGQDPLKTRVLEVVKQLLSSQE